MKKTLLFALIAVMPYFVIAQSSNMGIGQVDITKNMKKMKADAGYVLPSGPIKPSTSKGVVTDISISSSANVYSVLVEQQSCLTANKDLGLILFTHRADPSVVGTSSGNIVSSYSTNQGSTWTNMLNISDVKLNRYPSGQIYNPSGNTAVNNAYAVVCGPTTGGSGWTENFFGSKKFDNTNGNVSYTTSTSEELIRSGLVVCGNKAHVLGGTYKSTAPYDLYNMLMMNGTFNATANKFDWTCDTMKHQFVVASNGNEAVYYGSWNTAWSIDGQTGYYWILGRDSSNDVRSYQPVVWKTVNGGTTWNMMPVNDFSTIPDVANNLSPMNGGTTVRAQFTTNLDGVVDNSGALHFFTKVRGASSNHDDSLGYYWIARAGGELIYHFWTTTTGWTGNAIAVVYTKEVDDAESSFTGTDGGLGWDNRIQAGRTTDGTKVFASWTDTDTNVAAVSTDNFMLNSYPNIFVYGFNVTSGTDIGIMNATAGSGVDGDCYFHYMSDIILEDVTPGKFIIPLTKVSLGTAPENAVYHKYLKNVILDPNTIASQNKMNAIVSQNRPNPALNSTNIDITLTSASNLTIEVTNVVGQKVYEMNYGKVGEGLRTYQIPTSNLVSGVYFYTVKSGNQSVTKKMIVQ